MAMAYVAASRVAAGPVYDLAARHPGSAKRHALMGLFANRGIKEGARIAEYTGKPTTGVGPYVLEFGDGTRVDAQHSRSIARYANFARHAHEANAEYVNLGGRAYIVSSKYIPKNQEILMERAHGARFGARTKRANNEVYRLPFTELAVVSKKATLGSSADKLAVAPPNMWVVHARNPSYTAMRSVANPSIEAKTHQALKAIRYIAISDGAVHEGPLLSEAGRLCVPKRDRAGRIYLSSSACYETSCFYAHVRDKKLVACKLSSLNARTGLVTVSDVAAPFATRTLDPLDLLKLAISNEFEAEDEDEAGYVVDPAYRSKLLPSAVFGLPAGMCIVATTDALGAVVLSAFDYPDADEEATGFLRTEWTASDGGRLMSVGAAPVDVDEPIEGAKECSICLEKMSTHVFRPCGHLCVCSACAAAWRETSDKCPMCKKPGKAHLVTFSFGR
jgi:hypothetical protein